MNGMGLQRHFLCVYYEEDQRGNGGPLFLVGLALWEFCGCEVLLFWEPWPESAWLIVEMASQGRLAAGIWGK